MLSAREMAIDKNPSAANWLNTHFVYTHGYGVAMVPVNARPARRPAGPDHPGHAGRVRAGRAGDHPAAHLLRRAPVAVGRSRAPRPTSSTTRRDGATGDVTTRWTGTTGIRIKRRPQPAAAEHLDGRPGELPHLSPDHRRVAVPDAPLHRASGWTRSRRSWPGTTTRTWSSPPRAGWSGWSTATRRPTASRCRARSRRRASRRARRRRGRDFNYIRNSVKATVDAYDGTMHLYINDPNDPLIATWAGVYPTLFSPLSELPDVLDAAPALPGGDVQRPDRHVLGVPRARSRRRSTRATTCGPCPPAAAASSQVLPSEAYYVQMRLPGAQKTEYLLMQPMVPARRPNMIAWIAARNDRDSRGEVLVYQLPADTSIFGPAQVEARIDQTPEIAAQITLWDQAGSSVIRGNLIVVPVGGSFVYLSPVYLQSTSSAFPQFTKIVVATPVQGGLGRHARRRRCGVAVGEGPTGQVPIPTPGPVRTPAPGATAEPVRHAGTGRAADRCQRADRVRERPLRAGAGRDRGGRLRDVRQGDGAREARAQPVVGADRELTWGCARERLASLGAPRVLGPSRRPGSRRAVPRTTWSIPGAWRGPVRRCARPHQTPPDHPGPTGVRTAAVKRSRSAPARA